jgi:hypothetical protein
VPQRWPEQLKGLQEENFLVIKEALVIGELVFITLSTPHLTSFTLPPYTCIPLPTSLNKFPSFPYAHDTYPLPPQDAGTLSCPLIMILPHYRI